MSPGTSTDRLHPGLVHHIVNTLGWPSLRPLQESAVAPVLDGRDALLLAPTAGGKTEAAMFPVLSAMASHDWHGLSVLYVCPLRALLNNLEPRLTAYASWLGRTVGLWHGATPDGERRRLLRDRPDVLLTTPESLEAMLVSTRADPRELFGDLRVAIVDELHAIAGDDRGWHLLAVLERLTRLAGRPLQRLGLSATLGNPEGLLYWLQGGEAGTRSGVVITPPSPGRSEARVDLDYVGNVPNAAKVIASLHRGEKRLVFCESRQRVEELSGALRARGVETYLSHSSLSAEERRRSEQAFADAGDCVIVATSTLELGVDVGDLDRIVQIDAPRSVASFLQRLGRTGRRPGTSRNALFLATTEESLLRAAGLLHLWSSGFVEAVGAPPAPRHIAAQQLLALCLQEGRVGQNTWPEWWNGLPWLEPSATEIAEWLVETGHLETEDGMLLVGPEAERRFGRRNFMELLSVFTAGPEFVVLHGRSEVGSVDPMIVTRETEGPRMLLLGGRSWRVTHIDWRRRRCYVEPSDSSGRSGWTSLTSLPQPQTFELSRAQRDVLLGADPPVVLSRRATTALAELRESRGHQVAPGATAVVRSAEDTWWWTWAGARANATLAQALSSVCDGAVRHDNHRLRLRPDVEPGALAQAVKEASGHELPPPDVTAEAVRELKFAEVLPPHLAADTLGTRLRDSEGARRVLEEPRRWDSR